MCSDNNFSQLESCYQSLSKAEGDSRENERREAYLIIGKPPFSMERVSELGQWQKQEVKAHGTSWDVKSMDLALWTFDDIQITLREPLVLDRAATIERPGFWLPKAISEAIANSSKLEGQEAREKNPSEETMQLS
ncbi:hypothetical protein MTR67_017640 [Solanum verrucosum]|uniref:Uncharacterized protein n=1 Tax=Solanum verrucosum TaxID=315347 RepID=A0AAF0QN84_SOLVR|nr:hypothetical protein MTR67_017640 [Solanum verrucosum]